MRSEQQENNGATQTTLRQQLLRSHLRVAGLAAIAFVLVAIAIQMLNRPIKSIQLVSVPSANAAMTIQLGLQRSEANLRGWVALKNPSLRNNVELAWVNEIMPAFESLRKMPASQVSDERRQLLTSLDTQLTRLKTLQDWTIDVSAKDGNEPAKLVFTQEFGPTRLKIVNDINTFSPKQKHSTPKAQKTLFELRLALSEAESALGRFVVEGNEADAADYQHQIKVVRLSLASFDLSTYRKLDTQLNDLDRLSESIIDSRRSPRSNVAWHTISTRLAPLSVEIADKLAAIANHEVATMTDRVDQVATWTNWLSLGSILALLFVLIIALVFSNAEAKRISAPVTQLFRATEVLKNGDYNTILRPHGVVEVQGLIGAFNAMRESISHSHQELEDMAYTDELTGLANRKAFNNSIAAINEGYSSINNFSGVLIFDLDYFKQVNDSLGHDAGDKLLSVFSNRLKNSLRPTDQVARIGGDEFAVLLGSLENEDEARMVVERVIEETSQPITYQGDKIKPSATIGIAIRREQVIDANKLVKKADLALYDAKAKGRGGYCFYSNKMHEKATKAHRIAELIDQTDTDDMFRMVYQPYVDLSTGEFVGVEALLRCVHPECSAVPIIDIITMLERSGQISVVSEWVRKQATFQLKQWQDTISLPSDFTISVNVSAVLLRSASFTQTILDIVKTSGISGSSLMIEITETTVMEDYTRSRESMQQLNATTQCNRY